MSLDWTDEDLTRALEQPEVQATLVKFAGGLHRIISAISAAGESPQVRAGVAELSSSLDRLATKVRTAVEQVQPAFEAAGEAFRKFEAPPVQPGYETLLMTKGASKVEARLKASVIRYGARMLDEDLNRRRPLVIGHIRELARLRQPGWQVRRAAKLLQIPNAPSHIFGVLKESGLADVSHEFVTVLERTATGDREACRRAAEIARQVAPALPSLRGPRACLQTISHEALLEMLAGDGKEQGFTMDLKAEDFTDAATQATRLEFSNPDFDPRPAVRRFRRRTGRRGKR